MDKDTKNNIESKKEEMNEKIKVEVNKESKEEPKKEDTKSTVEVTEEDVSNEISNVSAIEADLKNFSEGCESEKEDTEIDKEDILDETDFSEVEDDLNNNLETGDMDEVIMDSVKEEIEEAFIEKKLSNDVENKAYHGDFKEELEPICEESELEESVEEEVEKAVLMTAEKVKSEKPLEKLGKNECIGFFTPVSINLDDCVGCNYESNCYSRKKAKERIGMSIDINEGKDLKVAPEKCFEEGVDTDMDYYEDGMDDEFEDAEEIERLLAPKLAKIEKLVKENQKQIKIGLCITGAVLGVVALIKLFQKD